jgi:hypothetical protein
VGQCGRIVLENKRYLFAGLGGQGSWGICQILTPSPLALPPQAASTNAPTNNTPNAILRTEIFIVN